MAKNSKFSNDNMLHTNTKQVAIEYQSRVSSVVERVTFNPVAVGSISTDGVMFFIILNFCNPNDTHVSQ